jgi:hypothetical protein
MEDERQPEQAELEIQARIRASFERQGLMRHLGARLGHVGPGRVHIELPNRPEVNQQHGYIHAGATSAIADSAGGHAAFTLFPENTRGPHGGVQDQSPGTSRRRSHRGCGNSPQVRTNPHRVPTRSVRLPRPEAVARGRRPADPDLHAGRIRAVTTTSRLPRVWRYTLVMTNRDNDLLRDLRSQNQHDRPKEN